MKLAEGQKFALSLPETTEQPHFDYSSFRIRGKIIATVPPDGDHLHVFIDEDTTRAATAHSSGAFEELWWGKRLLGVRVDLRAADADLVFDLLEESWRRRAPKRLAAQLAARARENDPSA